MPQFTYTNRLMEKCLRRAFLDGVMEIYESCNQPRVYSITLEGTLSLLINKTEKYYIKLQETAERAKEPDSKLLPKTRLIKLSDINKDRSDAKEPSDSMDCFVEQGMEEGSRFVKFKTETDTTDSTSSDVPTISTTKTPIMTFSPKGLQRIFKPTTTTVTVVSPKSSVGDKNTSISYTRCNDDNQQPKIKVEPNTTVSSTETCGIKVEPLDDQAVTSTDEGDLNKSLVDDIMVVQPEWIEEETDRGIKRNREDEEASTSSPSEEVKKKLKIALKNPMVSMKNPIMAINLPPSQKDMLYYHKNIVECPLCKEPINNQSFLALHLEKHRKELSEDCEDCKKEGRPIDALLYHFTNFHTIDGPRETEFQKIKAPTLNPVLHLSTSENRVDPSKIVKFMLDRESARNSEAQVKKEIPEDNESGQEYQIEYVCDICGDSFTSSKELTLHSQAEHEHTSGCYPCPSCPANFDDIFKFQDHILEHHKEDEKCKCQSCGMEFERWKDLKSHLLTAHRKFFTCPHCKVSFNDQESLKDHIALHGNEKPDFYECDMCDKSFVSSKTYNAHRRSHIDVKPYVCPICQSAFFKRGDMAKHMRTIHEPTKLYMCKICGRTGTRADNMRVHVRTHKKEITREQVDQLLQKVDQ